MRSKSHNWFSILTCVAFDTITFLSAGGVNSFDNNYSRSAFVALCIFACVWVFAYMGVYGCMGICGGDKDLLNETDAKSETISGRLFIH